jgi:hypothetical protein
MATNVPPTNATPVVPPTNATQVDSAKDILQLSGIGYVVFPDGSHLGATEAEVAQWSYLSKVEKRALVILMMQAYHARIAEAKRIAAELEAKIQAEREAILQEGKAKAEEEARIAAEAKAKAEEEARIAAEEAQFEFDCMSPEEQKAVLDKKAEAAELAKALQAVKEQEAAVELLAIEEAIISITAAEENQQLVLVFDLETAAPSLEEVGAAMRAALAEQDLSRDKAAKEAAAIVAEENAAKEAAEEALLAAAMAKAAEERLAFNANQLCSRIDPLNSHLALTASTPSTVDALCALKLAAKAELACLMSDRPGALPLETATKEALRAYKIAVWQQEKEDMAKAARLLVKTREQMESETVSKRPLVQLGIDISASMNFDVAKCPGTRLCKCADKAKDKKTPFLACICKNTTPKGNINIFPLGPRKDDKEYAKALKLRTTFQSFLSDYETDQNYSTFLDAVIHHILENKSKDPLVLVLLTDGGISGDSAKAIKDMMMAFKRNDTEKNLQKVVLVFPPHTNDVTIRKIIQEYGAIFNEGQAIPLETHKMTFDDPKGLEKVLNDIFAISVPVFNPQFPRNFFGELFVREDAPSSKVAQAFFDPRTSQFIDPEYKQIFVKLMNAQIETVKTNPDALLFNLGGNIAFLHELLRKSPLRKEYDDMLSSVLAILEKSGKMTSVSKIREMMKEAKLTLTEEVEQDVKSLNAYAFLRFKVDQLPADVSKMLSDGSFSGIAELAKLLFQKSQPAKVVDPQLDSSDTSFANLPLLGPDSTPKDCLMAFNRFFYGSRFQQITIAGLPLVVFLTHLLTTPDAHLPREFVEMALKVLFDNKVGILSHVGIDLETETDETFNPMPKGDKACQFFSPFLTSRVIALFKIFGNRFKGLSLVMKDKLFAFFEYIDDAYHKVNSMFSVLYEPKVEGVPLTPKSVCFEQVCTFKHDAELRVGSIVGIQFPSDKDPYPNNATVGLVLSIFEKDGELCVQVLELDQPNYQHTSKKGKVAFDTIVVRAENLTVLTKDPVLLPEKFTLDGKEVNTFSYKDNQVAINPAVCNSLVQGHVISSLNRYLMDKQASQATDSNGQLLYGLRALFNEDGSLKRAGCTFKQELLDAQNAVVAGIVSAFESTNPRVDFVKTVEHQFNLSKFTEMFGNTLGLHPLIVDHLRKGHTFINREVITRLMEAGMHQVYSPDAKSFKGITFAFFGESCVKCDFSGFYKELFAEVCAKNQVRQSFTPFTLLTEMVCGVCCDKHPIAEFTQAPCGHVFCTESQRNAMEAHPLLTGHLNTVVYRCFVEGCQRPIPSGNAAFDQFHLTLPIGAKATLCACGDFFQNEARVCGTSGQVAPLETECPKCLTAKAKPDGCTPCSQCGVFAIRNGGCQHMTCSQCDAYTCFGCGAPLSRDFPIGWWNCKAHLLGFACVNRKSAVPTCIENNRCEDCKELCGNVPRS